MDGSPSPVHGRGAQSASVPTRFGLATREADGDWRDVAEVIDGHRGQPFLLIHSPSGLRREMRPTPLVRQILVNIDGSRSWRNIFDIVRRQPGLAARSRPEADATDRDLFAEFLPWFQTLNSIERLLLRGARTSLA